MTCSIRQERPGDHAAVHALVRDAFAQAEHTNHQEQDLVDRLRAGDAFIPELSLVAEQGGRIVGHVLFTCGLLRDGEIEQAILVVGPVAVAPSFQRRGIGGRLIQAGHEVARGLGFAATVLVGHPAYYPRFGYRPAGDLGITTHLDLPPDVFMACELTPGGLAGIGGMLIYPKEFGL